MKTYISLIACALLLCLSAGAQTQDSTAVRQGELPAPAILQDMHNARIVQDEAVTRLLQEKIAGVVHGTTEMPGFRVQVYSSNRPAIAKSEAIKLKERLEGSISLPVYVISTPPFIKVRVGDFHTQEEAAACKGELMEVFPDLVGDTYVVRDEHIKVKQ